MTLADFTWGVIAFVAGWVITDIVKVIWRWTKR